MSAPLSDERQRCGVPCLEHAHSCDRSPDHTSGHRDVQQKGEHTCEWDTPGPNDVPALLEALKRSRNGGKELGKIVVSLAELIKSAYQRGETDPIAALHMLGDHLAHLFEGEGGLSADEHNRICRALNERQAEDSGNAPRQNAGKPVRPFTPPRQEIGDDGRPHTIYTVKRCCNGCGAEIGDMDNADVVAGASGWSLPDVRNECSTCTPPVAEQDGDERC